VHGGSWFASLGGGRPPVGLAACFLVNLVGEHGAAGLQPPFVSSSAS
jgi:hypothetical protein